MRSPLMEEPRSELDIPPVEVYSDAPMELSTNNLVDGSIDASIEEQEPVRPTRSRAIDSVSAEPTVVEVDQNDNSESAPGHHSAQLDIADLETIEGWEFFVNEAELSNPTRRCVANTHFKCDMDNSTPETTVCIIEIPSVEMMYWDSGQIDEVRLALHKITGVNCELQLKEVKHVENSVHQRQSTARDVWRQSHVEKLQSDPIVQKAMALNGAEFKPDRIRFNDGE